MRRKKESVSVGMASGHHTLNTRERERQAEEKRSILSPINLSSSGFIYFTVFFPFTCSHKLFSLQPLCFSNHVLLSVRERYCCGNSREGTRRPPNSKSLFFVFRLSTLSLSVFIYCTITEQFTFVEVQ